MTDTYLDHLSDPHDIDRVLARDQWISLGAEATVEQIARWLERTLSSQVALLVRSGAWKDPIHDDSAVQSVDDR